MEEERERSKAFLLFLEKYSLEAKELLSESQMFEVKAGAVVKDHLQQECSLCDSCIGCASACAVCVNDVL